MWWRRRCPPTMKRIPPTQVPPVSFINLSTQHLVPCRSSYPPLSPVFCLWCLFYVYAYFEIHFQTSELFLCGALLWPQTTADKCSETTNASSNMLTHWMTRGMPLNWRIWLGYFLRICIVFYIQYTYLCCHSLSAPSNNYHNGFCSVYGFAGKQPLFRNIVGKLIPKLTGFQTDYGSVLSEKLSSLQ